MKSSNRLGFFSMARYGHPAAGKKFLTSENVFSFSKYFFNFFLPKMQQTLSPPNVLREISNRVGRGWTRDCISNRVCGDPGGSPLESAQVTLTPWKKRVRFRLFHRLTTLLKTVITASTPYHSDFGVVNHRTRTLQASSVSPSVSSPYSGGATRSWPPARGAKVLGGQGVTCPYAGDIRVNWLFSREESTSETFYDR